MFGSVQNVHVGVCSTANVPWYLFMFGPVQKVHGDSRSSPKCSWYWSCLVLFKMSMESLGPCEKVLDIWSYLVLSKRSLRPLVHTKTSLIFSAAQNHLSWTWYTVGCFGHDHISRMFWPGSEVLTDVLDMTKSLLIWIRFSSLATLETKVSLVCYVDGLSGFKSFYFIWLHQVSVGTYVIFNASCKVFCWGAQTLVVACGLRNCGVRAYFLHGMWDLTSPARDWTSVPCTTRQILSQWTTSEVSGFKPSLHNF